MKANFIVFGLLLLFLAALIAANYTGSIDTNAAGDNGPTATHFEWNVNSTEPPNVTHFERNVSGTGAMNFTHFAWSLNTTKLPTAAPLKATVSQLFIIGNGIAVNPDDKLDFRYINAIIGRVLMPASNITGNSTDSPDLEVRCINTASMERCYSYLRSGVLLLDNERYTLRNIDASNDSVTATLYQNDTEVGSIALTEVTKLNRKVWVGTIAIGEKSYYAYILGGYSPLLVEQTTEVKWEQKSCGLKMPSVNASNISSCRSEGGRIYVGTDDNGCPMLPTCIKTNCSKITPITTQAVIDCRNSGGNLLGGVDDNGCPATPKCILPTGETSG